MEGWAQYKTFVKSSLCWKMPPKDRPSVLSTSVTSTCRCSEKGIVLGGAISISLDETKVCLQL